MNATCTSIGFRPRRISASLIHVPATDQVVVLPQGTHLGLAYSYIMYCHSHTTMIHKSLCFELALGEWRGMIYHRWPGTAHTSYNSLLHLSVLVILSSVREKAHFHLLMYICTCQQHNIEIKCTLFSCTQCATLGGRRLQMAAQHARAQARGGRGRRGRQRAPKV